MRRDLPARLEMAFVRYMSDVFTKAKRSLVMSCIRGTVNKDTELRLIAILRAHRITGWRRRHRLVGKPDFVFQRERLAIFVDGCYWHGCPQHATWPKNNAEFWRAKILGNQQRDRTVNRLLRKAGWRVIRIWEHALTKRHEARTAARLQRIITNLRGDRGLRAGSRMSASIQGWHV